MTPNIPTPKKPAADGPTALYRFFDATDALLYVGVTNDPEQRWRDHARDKEWWPSVTRKTTVWHGSRAEALRAEAKAIHDEQPRYNTMHRNQEELIREHATAMALSLPPMTDEQCEEVGRILARVQDRIETQRAADTSSK